jgi:hypothetical protein
MQIRFCVSLACLHCCTKLSNVLFYSSDVLFYYRLSVDLLLSNGAQINGLSKRSCVIYCLCISFKTLMYPGNSSQLFLPGRPGNPFPALLLTCSYTRPRDGATCTLWFSQSSLVSHYDCMTMTVWLWLYDYDCMTMTVWLWLYDYDCMTMTVWLGLYDYDCMTRTVWLGLYD